MISEDIDAYTADLSARHKRFSDNESSDADEESDSEDDLVAVHYSNTESLESVTNGGRPEQLYSYLAKLVLDVML